MKLTIAIVDNLSKLNTSNTIIPDGVIVKVAGSNEFKIGNGINKYSELPDLASYKSVYDLAVESGFTGNQEEWLISLIGDTGPKGDTGVKGATGADGRSFEFTKVYHSQQEITADTTEYEDGDFAIISVLDPEHPDYAKNGKLLRYEAGAWYEIADLAGPQGIQGKPFQISVIFESVAEMQSDSEEREVGDLALIDTGNVQDVDNAKMYVWNGSTWSFLVDLSGAQGIQGPTGNQGPIGATGPVGATGKSAYDVAVDNGFEGTAQEWLTAINVQVGAMTMSEYETDVLGS